MTALVLIFIFFRNIVARKMIRRKMRELELEKKVIFGLIQDTQKLYFDKNKISEEMYSVRIRKFGEIIRDIERQLPLLRADLEGRRGFFDRIMGWK